MKYSHKINDVMQFMNSPEFKGELIDASLCTEIAIELFRMRTSKGLTQAQLASKMGLNQSHIARWESPGYQGYKIKILSKLARMLGKRLRVTFVEPEPNYNFVIRTHDHDDLFFSSFNSNGVVLNEAQ